MEGRAPRRGSQLRGSTYPHPYSSRRTMSPTRQSNHSIEAKREGNHKRKPANRLRVGAHLRHSIRKLQHLGEEYLSGCADDVSVTPARQ